MKRLRVYLKNVHSNHKGTGCRFKGDIIVKKCVFVDGIFINKDGKRIRYSNYRSSRKRDRDFDQYCIMGSNYLGGY